MRPGADAARERPAGERDRRPAPRDGDDLDLGDKGESAVIDQMKTSVARVAWTFLEKLVESRMDEVRSSLQRDYADRWANLEQEFEQKRRALERQQTVLDAQWSRLEEDRQQAPKRTTEVPKRRHRDPPPRAEREPRGEERDTFRDPAAGRAVALSLRSEQNGSLKRPWEDREP